MARIGWIFTDTESVRIRVIRVIRVPYHIKSAANNGFFIPIYELPFLADFALSAVDEIVNRKERKERQERKVFIIYDRNIKFLTIIRRTTAPGSITSQSIDDYISFK